MNTAYTPGITTAADLIEPREWLCKIGDREFTEPVFIKTCHRSSDYIVHLYGDVFMDVPAETPVTLAHLTPTHPYFHNVRKY
ncbi:hypothetical protein [Brevibacterium moorei]|uniref:hypothetical protein n=1 Tax=Brevibacterium moorei TaxID=2968457 RepID=UPI00211C6734|nr:hypothetical protein [Brevibacterium sp. 68QC2CO]MCQ9384430.1 hypothetical protein [Brevibacterium sp. 68QC2CO]